MMEISSDQRKECKLEIRRMLDGGGTWVPGDAVMFGGDRYE